MRFDLSQSGLKSVITAGIFSLVAIGVLLNWAVPVSAQNSAPAKPDTPTLRALHQGMVEVDWNDVSGANRYEVQFYTSSGWIDLPNAGLGIEIVFDGSRAVATGLPEDLNYDAFHVRTGNSVGWSEWSEYAWQMTTHNMDWEGIPVPTIEPTPEPVNTPATGAPMIGGTAQVGETLTASTSGIADADGLTNVSYRYQWLRNDGSSDTDITDATDSTYTLEAADEGNTIEVKVSFTDDADNDERLTSAATGEVEARPNRPATGAPMISGTAQVGETLTASTSGIADADGLTNVSYSHQWIRSDGSSDTDIQDAIGSTYTLVAADEGKSIKVKVSFTDDADNEETLTSTATAEVAAGTPTDPPGAPRNLTGTANSDGAVTLSWDAPAQDAASVTGYEILRHRPEQGEPMLLILVSDTQSTATAYVDATANEPGVSYVYRVKALRGGVKSAWSNYARIDVPEDLTTDGVADDQEETEETCPGSGYNPTPTAVTIAAVPIVVDSTTADYFVLYVSHDVDDTEVELPVLVKRGETGTTALAENVEALPRERYRVEKYLIADPADVDGDCIDDITELDDFGSKNPVNAASSIDLRDGAVGIADRATFEALAQVYPLRSNKLQMKFVVFGIDTESPRVYFIDSSRYQLHFMFRYALVDRGIEQDEAQTTDGFLYYYPNLEAADGSLGVYFAWDTTTYSFAIVDRLFTVIAASMPLLEQDLAYHLRNYQLPAVQDEFPLYEDSRIHLLLDEDIEPEDNFLPLNEEVGFGLLRVLEPDERPSLRDVVIYETLPNNLPRVAGIISTVPQTPLSHVNLRAIQDGVPNAFIRDALDNDDIESLIGGYVRYEVKRARYRIRAATREEVDAHYDSSRPSQPQTPQRDLSVTEITQLSEIGFDDWDAFGVKAANVAVLRTLGFPEGTIPDGFAIPFYFYDEFMKHNDFSTRIETMLADADFQENFDTQDEELKDLRDAIEDGETPAWILTALADMNTGFPEGTTNRKYRSSTNNEDLPGFNGAGLYDSKSQKPDEDEEDGLDKSLKEVYASLWNFRAFTERDFHRIDHLTAAMGILVHPSYQDELVNGVAVSFDPIGGGREGFYYVNSQLGEDLVTNPDAHSVPEEIRCDLWGKYEVLATSNQVAPGKLLMSDRQLGQLCRHLEVIHDHFAGLYNPAPDEPFAMEIEFKITSDNVLAIKQARPWVFSGAATPAPGKTLPSAPINLAVAPGDTSLTVVWDQPANTGGESPTGYDVRYIMTSEDETDDANWTEQLGAWTESSGVRSYTITGLETGVQYDVQVRAENSVGKGPWSAATLQVVDNDEVTFPVVSIAAVASSVPEHHWAWFSISRTGPTMDDLDVNTRQTLTRGADSEVVSMQWRLRAGRSQRIVGTLVAGDDIVREDVTITETLEPGEGYLVAADANTATVVVVEDDVAFADQQQIANSAATGAPTISGTVQVGETLTADTSGIADADGLTNVTYSYQWIGSDGSADTDITGATGSSYTLVDADEGQAIKVEVTFADDAGNGESLTSGATATVAARPNSPATGAPTISGTAQVGETLTAYTSGIADADGLTNVSYSYQWVRNDGSTDTDVQDATGSTHTLVDADEGQTIKVEVTFADDAGNGESLTSGATGLVAARPNTPATGAPTISGTTQVGEMLTASTSGIADADGLTNVAYSYQWVRNDGSSDTDIGNATGGTYALVDADEGQAIKVKVSFTDDAGNEESLASGATATVAARPNTPATGAPTISGTTQVGEMLTASTSGIADADGLTNVAYSYQWVRNDGSSDTDIGNATGGTYALVDADEGQAIKVKVSFTDDAGNEEILTSVATGLVAARPNTPATGAPTISGTVQVGGTLTASTSSIADADGLTNVSYSYRWIRRGSTDTDITGATDSSHTLVDADEGQNIKVKVTFSDDAGNEETLTSAATAEVAAGAPTDPPAAPRNLRGAANADGTVTLSWDAPDDDTVTGYQILRRRPTEGENTLLVHVNDTGSTATEYTDRNVTPDVRHAYRVKAINAVGLGKQSNYVAVTPAQPAADPPPDEDEDTPPAISVSYPEASEEPGAVLAFLVTLDRASSSEVTVDWRTEDNTAQAGQDYVAGTGTVVFAAGQTRKTVNVSVLVDDDDDEPSETMLLLLSDATGATIAKSIGVGAILVTTQDSPTIYLTFDDGPSARYTPQILDLLSEYGARATFFVTGEHVATNLDLAARIATEGHAIANHSWQHENLTTLTIAQFNSTILRTHSIIGPYASHCMRPPYGRADRREKDLAEALGFEVVLWTLNTNDWKGPGADLIAERALAGASDKAIILMHDTGGHGQTVEALGVILDRLSEQGYRFEPVCDIPEVDEQALNRPSTGAPVIHGITRVNELLTADASAVADPDRMTDTQFVYQWLADNVEIANGTSSSYLVAAEDEGKTIMVRIDFTDDQGHAESLTSKPSAPVTEANPYAGTPSAPQSLSVTPIGRNGELAVSWNAPASSGGTDITGYSVQWKLSSAYWGIELDVQQAETSDMSYHITGLAEASEYAVRVRAINQAGEGTSSPQILASPAGDPPLLAEFEDPPEYHRGRTLFPVLLALSENIKNSHWDLRDTSLQVLGGQVIIAKRVSQRSDLWNISILPDGTGHVTIFLPVAKNCSDRGAICAYGGKRLANRLELTVPGPIHPATVQPTVTGTPGLGEILTADTTGISDPNGMEDAAFTYQWMRDPGIGDTAIPDATGASYTVVPEDEGHRIKVQVSFTDDDGFEETVISNGVYIEPPPPLRGGFDADTIAEEGVGVSGIVDGDDPVVGVGEGTGAVQHLSEDVVQVQALVDVEAGLAEAREMVLQDGGVRPVVSWWQGSPRWNIER